MSRRDLTSLVSYKVRQGDGDGWNKVKLLNASRYEKEDVLRALVNSYQQLQPLSFQKQGMNYVFYVETRTQVLIEKWFYVHCTTKILLTYLFNYYFDRNILYQANALNALDHKVVLSDGTTTLNISAEPSAPPQTTVNEEMIEKIKVVMSDRYIAETKGKYQAFLNKYRRPPPAPLGNSYECSICL